ncbi:hypothetical protein CMV_013499 [Castanea mollissima]|uniref:Uncharacterized protein n=1 Tax=Castanea mollissima TaxID=60419 RepID=A0A8J4R806_9ROSI|nr:hypothetical protein CMV_013499 [Castanea mollissima]
MADILLSALVSSMGTRKSARRTPVPTFFTGTRYMELYKYYVLSGKWIAGLVFTTEESLQGASETEILVHIKVDYQELGVANDSALSFRF